MRWLLVAGTLCASHAWADVGIEAGARAGVDFADDQDLFVGADVRLAFPASPLTINPTFDYFFVGADSLVQLGASALYYLPLQTIKPYVGVGFSASRFVLDTEPTGPISTVDNEGIRAGLNVIAGGYLDLPIVKPYVQATTTIGDIDLYMLSVGVVTNFGRATPAPSKLTPEHARLLASPYLLAHLAGDVEAHRGGAGASVGYYRGHLGFEADVALHGHFFKDADLEGLVPDGVDLNTRGVVVTGNVVVPYQLEWNGLWTPYVLAGAGIAHGIFDAVNAHEYDRTQDDLLVDASIGVMHALTRHVGFRVDLRYSHVFVDETATSGGIVEDYDFLRVSVGLTVGVGM